MRKADSKVEKGARIGLSPEQGSMVVRLQIPQFNNQIIHLVTPKTIACREMMLLNFPEVTNQIKWEGPDAAGCLWC